MSVQLSDGSNWLLIIAARLVGESASIPALSAVCDSTRGCRRKSALQRGRRSPSTIDRAVTRGGTANPLRRSRSRWPARGTSTVTTSAV